MWPGVCQSCVTMTFSNAGAMALMTGTTSSPPFTGSVPPVTKQFCTSMTSKALFASGLTGDGRERERAAELAAKARPLKLTRWTNSLRGMSCHGLSVR